MNDYVVLSGKRYKVQQELYEPVVDRQRVFEVGLTGKTIGLDFTVAGRVPKQWRFRLRVFIATDVNRGAWGTMADLYAAYHNSFFVTLVLHDGTMHEVGFMGEIKEVPRVGANIEGHCDGILFVDVVLVKIYL